MGGRGRTIHRVGRGAPTLIFPSQVHHGVHAEKIPGPREREVRIVHWRNAAHTNRGARENTTRGGGRIERSRVPRSRKYHTSEVFTRVRLIRGRRHGNKDWLKGIRIRQRGKRSKRTESPRPHSKPARRSISGRSVQRSGNVE